MRYRMKRFIALLRGINISGRNRIAMADLKPAVEELGYENVVTHLNSGNVIFSSDEENETVLTENIKMMLDRRFAMKIPVFVIGCDELESLLDKAPDWWGTADKNIYDNLIFVIPPADVQELCKKIGAPTEGLEQIQISGNAVFWSFDRQKYAKANWWKRTAEAGIGEMITIRTANTLRKIVKM